MLIIVNRLIIIINECVFLVINFVKSLKMTPTDLTKLKKLNTYLYIYFFSWNASLSRYNQFFISRWFFEKSYYLVPIFLVTILIQKIRDKSISLSKKHVLVKSRWSYHLLELKAFFNLWNLNRDCGSSETSFWKSLNTFSADYCYFCFFFSFFFRKRLISSAVGIFKRNIFSINRLIFGRM